MKNATVGMPILFFASGAAEPFAGTIVGVLPDNKVNVAYYDQTGCPLARQGLPLVAGADEGAAGGDYVIVAPVGGDSTEATKAHAKAMRKAGQNVPEGEAESKADSKVRKARAERGDFTSAAMASDNVQDAGSGGPFDPANTSKAHQTQHQTLESLSPGNPTTGGVTPKLSADSLANVSERDREAAAAIDGAKTPAEASRQANAGTGLATPGTARDILAAAARRQTLAQAQKVAEAADTLAQAAETPNQEVSRLQREKMLNEEAQRVSAERTAEREQPAEKKAAKADTAQAKVAAVPAKKAAAKKVAAKVPAKKVAAKKVAAKKAR